MTKTQHGIMACVIGATTWGINGVVSQFLLSNYPVEPSWVATIRMSLAGLLLTLMVIPKKSHLIRQMLHDPISLRHLIIFSIFGLILSQFAYLSSIKNSNAGTATVLQTLCVVFMSLYLAVRFRKQPTTREIISVILAFGGVYLAATQGNPSTMVLSPLGLAWGLIGAVSCVTYPVLSQGLAAHWGALITNGLGMIIGKHRLRPVDTGVDELADPRYDGLDGRSLHRHRRNSHFLYGLRYRHQRNRPHESDLDRNTGTGHRLGNVSHRPGNDLPSRRTRRLCLYHRHGIHHHPSEKNASIICFVMRIFRV